MPRKGLNESTSLSSADREGDVLSSAAARRRGGASARPGARNASQQRRRRRRRRSRSTLTHRDRVRPARGAARAVRAHASTACRARTPTTGCARDDARRCSGTSPPSGAFYDSSVCASAPLVSTLQAEMVSRVPPTDVSARWRRMRFSYYTRHLAGSDYEQSVGKSTVSRPFRNRIRCRGDSTTKIALAERRSLLDVGVAGRRQRLPRPRRDPGQPRRGPARLLRRHHRRRGLRAALPRPAHRRRPRRGGAAQLLRRRLERRLGVLLLHRPRRGLPAAPGLAAPDRHPGRRRRAGAGGARRAVRARPSAPRRSGDGPGPAQREPRHRRGAGWSTPTTRVAAPRSVGGRRRGVQLPRRARSAGRRLRRLLLVTNDDAAEFRLVRRPVPRDADQDHTAWRQVRPEDPAERLERVDAFAGARRAQPARRRSSTGSGVVPLDDLAGRRARVLRQPVPGGTVALAAQPAYDAAAVTVVDRVATSSRPLWSDVDLGTGERRERAPPGGAGHDPARYVTERLTFPAAGRHRRAGRPWSGTGTPRSTAPRRRCSTATAPTRPSTSRSGTRRCRACSTAAWSTSHAHVRGGGEGGRRWWLDGRLAAQAAHVRRPHRGRRRARAGAAWSTGDAIATRGLSRRRPAAGRGVQPAPGPVARRGGRGAVRRRGDDDVRRRRSR